MSRSSFGYIKKHGKYGKYRVYWSENKQRKSRVVDNLKVATELLAIKRLENGYTDSTVTFNAYYKNVVQPSYKNLAKRSIYDYEYTWEKIKPFLGNKEISETGRKEIQNVIDKFESPKMQQKIFVLLRKIYNMAIIDNIALKNPCDKGIRRLPQKKKIKKLYTAQELNNVLNMTYGSKFAIAVLLECVCGLRHEELCGLSSEDFEIDGKARCVYITIEKALTEVNGQKILKSTKNCSSTRLVALDYDVFGKIFSDHISKISKKNSLKDYPWQLKLTKQWKRVCDNYKIPHIPFASMRSVYATLCSEAGCMDSIVGKSMGHSGNNMKEKIYQNITRQALAINAKALGTYINYNYDKKLCKRIQINKENDRI